MGVVYYYLWMRQTSNITPMSTESLFTDADLKQLEEHGISLEEAIRQVESIRKGFPYLQIQSSASIERGIVQLSNEEESFYMTAWEDYLHKNPTANVCKMVPASGAASRMFKSLFNFLNTPEGEPLEPKVEIFINELQHFAFYEALGRTCLRNTWKSIPKLLETKAYKTIVENLLSEKGLGYGLLPKGMLLFHYYPDRIATAAEEHLVEGALYARHIDGRVRVHFTVSPEHRTQFKALLTKVQSYYEDRFGVSYDISYSEQKSSTDTLALTAEGDLFRGPNGTLLLRPGGHGALISNLSELDADIVFIKNIDNVVPDHLKGETVMYKKLLGGILIMARKQIHEYLHKLESGHITEELIAEICHFLRESLCIDIPEFLLDHREDLIPWLIKKLDRPIRVCGMVKNEGEPGGGPFIIREADGSTSLQILESSQINMADAGQRTLFAQASHFNPVDLVCSLRNHRGEPYDLNSYVNHKTAFLSNKSQGGRELRALERPGLWNGAMHHWTTIFVDVPLGTFNPVKEVNDLLRPEHQSK